MDKLRLETARIQVQNITKFIEHNEKLGYINENITLKEFKVFLNNVDVNYFGVLEKIHELTETM